MKHHTTLTYIKIIVCCLIFFCVPVFTDVLTELPGSRTIALTLSINTVALFLIAANHQLAALHWRRFISSIKENIIYVLFSALFIWAAVYLSNRFFAFQLESIDLGILSKYPFFAPIIVLTYTFSYAFCFNITYKLMTDKIQLHCDPQIVILLSGLMFGIYMTLSQFVVVPLLNGSLETIDVLKGFCINFLVSLCCSYCYNQTRSILPMTFGLSLASLILLL